MCEFTCQNQTKIKKHIFESGGWDDSNDPKAIKTIPRLHFAVFIYF